MVIVITHWWDGYECELDEVDWIRYQPVLCNYCLEFLNIVVPVDWSRIEALCQTCNDSSGDESV